MDGQHMDQIARAFARGVTRRRVMKALLGGAVAGALVPLAGRHAQASACANNCDCPTNSRCFNGQCTTGKVCRNKPYTKLCKFSEGASGCIEPGAETCPNACST